MHRRSDWPGRRSAILTSSGGGSTPNRTTTERAAGSSNTHARGNWKSVDGNGGAHCRTGSVPAGLAGQPVQGNFGGILAGVVDVLAIVPEAGGVDFAEGSDGRGPGGSAACRLSQHSSVKKSS